MKTKSPMQFYEEKVKDLFDENAQLEELGRGFEWAEGPVWISEQDMLLFSDVPANRIYKWTEKKGVEPYLEPSGFTGENTDSPEPGSNGLIYDQQKSLVLCQHGDRRIARLSSDLTNPEPVYESIASQFEGRRFNSPNDLVQHSDGSIYFTDPPYGLLHQDKNASKEIPFSGIFKVAPSGEVKLLSKEMTRPNGLAFSPDEETLYVANSDPEKAFWIAYALDENGMFRKSRVFYNVTSLVPEMRGLPDGLKVHPSGYIFATGPGGIFVISPEGNPAAKITIPQATANCAFDDIFSYLYLTSDSILYRMPLKV